MRRTFAVVLLAVGAGFLFGWPAQAQDPFAAGEDALAVADDDGSSSLRAKLKLKKMEADMIMVKVEAVNDTKYPDCVLKAKVLKTATAKDKHFKLMGRGKSYKFAPVYKMTSCKGKKGKKKKKCTPQIDLSDDMTQSNLGLCYYPKKTKLVIKVTGVDLKAKTFKAGAVYLKK